MKTIKSLLILLSSLTFFISRNLCKDDTHNWQAVLRSMLGESDFGKRHRNAKKKSGGFGEEPVCRAMLLDWMKTQAVHVDKLSPIMNAMKRSGTEDIAESCMEFVRIQKENLSDAVLSDVAGTITKDVQILGQTLGISNKEITSCINQHPDIVKDQYIAVLKECRESEDVIEHGDKALEYLKAICV